jgi:hypothetical protein
VETKTQPLPGWPAPLTKQPSLKRAKKKALKDKTKQLSFQYFDNSDPMSFPAVYSAVPSLRRETIARRRVNKIGRR